MKHLNFTNCIINCCNLKNMCNLARRWFWTVQWWHEIVKEYNSVDYMNRLLWYTGFPRRNVPDFGRVFLMLKYTDITRNIYDQSWTVMEIKVGEKCGLLTVPRTVPGSHDVIPIRCALTVLVYSRLKCVPRCDCTCKVLGNLRKTMTWVRVFL